MPVNWNSEESQEWLELCRKEHQEYYEFLGRKKFTKYKKSDFNNLKRNIGFALCGSPYEEPLYENAFLGYNRKQRKLIDQIFNLMKKYKKHHADKENIFVSFVFVSAKMAECYVRFGVVRVPKFDTHENDKDIFIDSIPRVYKGWQDYLDNNPLPKCLMCYPKNGMYWSESGKLQLDMSISPVGRIGSKVLKSLDITSTVAQVAGAGVGLAAIFTPVGLPVLLGAAGVAAVTGVYSSGRNIAVLRDRNVHHQSLSIRSAESRNCYFNIIGSVMGIASGGATAVAERAVHAGETITMAGQMVLKAITTTSCAVNALGVVSSITNVVDKAIRNELTSLELFQLTSAVLFFTSSLISLRQARLLTRKEPGKVIFNQIANIAEMTAESLSGIFEISIVSGAMLGCESLINASFFDGIHNTIQNKLLEVTILLWRSEIEIVSYLKQAGQYLNEFWESWNREIAMVIEKVFDFFEVKQCASTIVGGCNYFAEKNRDFLNDLGNTILKQRREFQEVLIWILKFLGHFKGVKASDKDRSTMPNEESHVADLYDEAVVDISKKFADMRSCGSDAEFIKYLNFVCKCVKHGFIEEIQKYNETLKLVRTYSPEISIEEFDRSYRVPTKNRNCHFLRKILSQFESQDGFLRLRGAYDIIGDYFENEEVHDYSSKSKDIHIEPFYNKVGIADDGSLSEEQFYGIAAQMLGENASAQNVSFQEYSGTAIMIADVNTTIIIRTYQQDRKISGIAVLIRDRNQQYVILD